LTTCKVTTTNVAMAPAPTLTDTQFAAILAERGPSMLAFTDGDRWSPRGFCDPLRHKDRTGTWSPHALMYGIQTSYNNALGINLTVHNSAWIEERLGLPGPEALDPNEELDLNLALPDFDLQVIGTRGPSPQAELNWFLLNFAKHPCPSRFKAVLDSLRMMTRGELECYAPLVDVVYVFDTLLDKCSEVSGIPMHKLLGDVLDYGVQRFPPAVVNLYLRSWLPTMYAHGIEPLPSHYSFLATYDAEGSAAEIGSVIRAFMDNEHVDTVPDLNENTIDTAAFLEIADVVMVRSPAPRALVGELTAISARLGCMALSAASVQL